MPQDVVTAARRARAILESFAASEQGSAEVFETFAELDTLSGDIVRDALGSWLGPLPDLEAMDNPTRLAQGLPLRPLRLTTLAVIRDADVLDLGPIAEEQLRLAGKSWDGKDLAPEERLDGEIEGSFAGSLERRVLADADAPGEPPRFDVFLFEDAGAVFEAGTTRVVALIAYGRVEMRDRRTRAAIEAAIATPAVTPSPVPVPPSVPAAPAARSGVERAPPKTAAKRAPKKATAKKAAAKKTATKTTVKKVASPKAATASTTKKKRSTPRAR